MIQFECIVSLPADLSSFGKQNDIQMNGGFGTYSFPAEDRMSPELYVLAYINYTYTKEDGSTASYAEESAKYGEGPRKKVYGRVIHVSNKNKLDDHTACTYQLTDPKGRALPKDVPWIALIKRGECKFDEKVKNVYEHRAIGAIVYNHLDAPNLDKMKIEDKSRKYTHYFFFVHRALLNVIEHAVVWLLPYMKVDRVIVSNARNFNLSHRIFNAICLEFSMLINLQTHLNTAHLYFRRTKGNVSNCSCNCSQNCSTAVNINLMKTYVS